MDLQTLLVALMSENNDIRSQAEKSLNDEWLKNAPDSLLLQLGAQSRVAESETVSCAIQPYLTSGSIIRRCAATPNSIQDTQIRR
jgi:hypothetical protein